MDYSIHPPHVKHLHAVMEVWDGDSLIAAFPCFAFEDRLVKAILHQELTGIEFEEMEMTKNPEYANSLPKEDLPPFVRGIVTGQKGIDDFYLSEDFILVVSKRALDVIKSFPLKYAEIIEQ